MLSVPLMGKEKEDVPLRGKIFGERDNFDLCREVTSGPRLTQAYLRLAQGSPTSTLRQQFDYEVSSFDLVSGDTTVFMYSLDSTSSSGLHENPIRLRGDAASSTRRFLAVVIFYVLCSRHNFVETSLSLAC
jgi:hypothetical protein